MRTGEKIEKAPPGLREALFLFIQRHVALLLIYISVMLRV